MTSLKSQGLYPDPELIKQLETIQNLLASKAILHDDSRLKEDYEDDLPLPKLVGSTSLSVTQDEPDIGYLALIIYDTEECEVVHKVIQTINLENYKDLKLTQTYLEKHFPDKVNDLFPLKLNENMKTIPYITNFLAFREVEPYAEVILGLEEKYRPKLLLSEGGGRLHPRKCGLATHLGLLTDIPTIGVAKDLLEVGKWNRHQVKEDFKDLEGGETENLDYQDEIVGKVLKPVESNRLVYISAGHLISVDTSTKLIKELSDFRIPEPLRVASLSAREARRKALEQ